MAESPNPPKDHRAETPLTSEATVELLERARQGDDEALDRLIARSIPPLRRWAHGRLPTAARGMNDTADLVQDTIISALRHLDGFQANNHGALQAYLRQAVMNRIRDLGRQVMRRPLQVEFPEQLHDRQPTPLDVAIGAQNVDRYEAALQRLAPADREAIISRIELQYDYDELAVLLNKPSASAARMAVTRAMKRLLEEIRRG